MDTIQQLKEQLGFSNLQLANYLGVTVSHLSMAQSGRRNLPTNAGILLSRLLLLQLNTAQGTATAEEKKQTNTALTKRISKAKHQLAIAKKKLESLQTKYSQLRKLVQTAEAMLQNPITGKDAKKEKLWAKAMAAEAAGKLKKCSIAKQTLLQLQINSLLYEIDQANQLKQ